MRWMQLWLYLLGAVTVLVIALRRVLRRQGSMNDKMYSIQVAIDYVQSGVAWVRADGSLGSVNPALAQSLRALPKELLGRQWETLFPENSRADIREAYNRALIMGRVTRETTAARLDGSSASVSLMLVIIHDRKMRLVGHYCLIEDRSRELELEEQLQRASANGRSQPAGADCLVGQTLLATPSLDTAFRIGKAELRFDPGRHKGKHSFPARFSSN
jgi:PAS domain S-box-containing protein